jgi:hypothetical protein
LAKVLAKIDQMLYEEHITYEKGIPVIYAKLSKGLYRTLQAALLFWEELSFMLVKECGFEVNPSDECVVNKIVNRKQCCSMAC